MPREYIVKQGDDLISIAGRFGFADDSRLVQANTSLDRKPGVLHPGDRVSIPDLTVTKLDASEKETNAFKLTAPKRKVRIPLTDDQGRPLAGENYTLMLGETAQILMTGTTDSDGLIQAEIAWSETEVTLILAHSTIKLLVAHMNPVERSDDGGRSGVAQRLALLGYHPGPLDGHDRLMLQLAIAAFQRDHEMVETAEADPDTVQKLEELATVS